MLDTLELGQLDPAQVTLVAARYKERLGSTPPCALSGLSPILPRRRPAPTRSAATTTRSNARKAIAKALTEAGIPEKMIQTEAKPAAGPLAASRVEIQFLP